MAIGSAPSAPITPETTVAPREAWTAEPVVHSPTGQSIAPDEQTGTEWSVEWRNPNYPAARVVTTYAVMRYPTDENGNRINSSAVADEGEHPHWQYAVDEVTEAVTGTDPDDPWGTETWSDREYGEGSFLSYDDEVSANAECERLARREAAMTGVITWDGTPSRR